ncbi:ribosome 60S biogenesis N-terminal-domain-containing protein [Dipodascopsis tothii]|uniref:ribosome 60S biogenesis N-terminal-domain-containing protein n=1 Tax=Dipodascopsis tothii TaxID=44089 RepID=UPI0034CD8672
MLKRKQGDPSSVFQTLDQILSSVDHVSANEFLESLSNQIEYGLFNELIKAWATTGASGVNNNSFIEETKKLHSLLNVLDDKSLCRSTVTSILRSILDDHMKLFYRSLSSQRQNVVTNALRFYRRIVCYHNGILASDCYESFDISMNVLPKLLAPSQTSGAASTMGTAAGGKKQTIRGSLIQLLLSFLQFGSSHVRSDLLSQKRLMVPLMKGAQYDDSELLFSLVSTLRTSVLTDWNIPRTAKISFFNEWVLSRLLTCYDRNEKQKDGDNKSLAEHVHRMLMDICTIPNLCICFADNGWYHPGTMGGPETTFKVHNRVLLSFLKLLQPLHNEMHKELLLAILNACPELIAHYMTQGTIKFEPKENLRFLSAAHIISSILSTPIPANLRREESEIGSAPPKEVVIENIVPSILVKSSVSHGLAHNSQLIKYYTSSILVSSLLKYKSVKAIYENNGWIADRDNLAEEVYRRLPDLQTIAVLVNGRSSNSLSTLAASKLLSLYEECFSEPALKPKIDIGPALKHLLEERDSRSGLSTIRLKYLLRSAIDREVFSKWWNRAESQKYSLFVMALRFSVSVENAEFADSLTHLLEEVTYPTSLFVGELGTDNSPIRRLVSFMKSVSLHESDNDLVWSVINEAVARCVRSPYKYIDRYRSASTSGEISFSPFMTAVIEQLGFIDSHSSSVSKEAIKVLCGLLRTFCDAGNDRNAVVSLMKAYKPKQANVATALVKFQDELACN